VESNERMGQDLAAIREAYTDKINAAVGRGEEDLAVELSEDFNDEVFLMGLDVAAVVAA
jgi:hypothetical protein